MRKTVQDMKVGVESIKETLSGDWGWGQCRNEKLRNLNRKPRGKSHQQNTEWESRHN